MENNSKLVRGRPIVNIHGSNGKPTITTQEDIANCFNNKNDQDSGQDYYYFKKELKKDLGLDKVTWEEMYEQFFGYLIDAGIRDLEVIKFIFKECKEIIDVLPYDEKNDYITSFNITKFNLENFQNHANHRKIMVIIAVGIPLIKYLLEKEFNNFRYDYFLAMEAIKSKDTGSCFDSDIDRIFSNYTRGGIENYFGGILSLVISSSNNDYMNYLLKRSRVSDRLGKKLLLVLKEYGMVSN